MRLTILCVCCLSSVATAGLLASEVGGVPLRTIRFVGIGADPIVVTAIQASYGLTSLRVRAFHRRIALTAAQLHDLRHFTVAGMQLAGEGGYKKFGGAALYLTLYGDLPDGSDGSCVVEVSERGTVTVSKPR